MAIADTDMLIITLTMKPTTLFGNIWLKANSNKNVMPAIDMHTTITSLKKVIGLKPDKVKGSI